MNERAFMNLTLIKELLLDLGLAVNKKCIALLTEESANLNREVKVSPADIIYQIDIEAEEEIIAILNDRAVEFGGIELIAEGIGDDDLSFYPANCKNPGLKIICDPIDGSRGIMYGKRSAFFLAAAGPVTAQTLKQLPVSVMVELPVPKQFEFDVLSAIKGEGVSTLRYNKNYESRPITLSATTSTSVEGGFMSMARFCYPGKDLVSRIEEQFLDNIFRNRTAEYLPVFEDQYISTGGQLYELICGHDRFTADFRASMYSHFSRIGKSQGQVCHPYDMAALLIAEEAGIIITDVHGEEFDCPLGTINNIDWLGYANEAIRMQCEKTLQKLLIKEKLI